MKRDDTKTDLWSKKLNFYKQMILSPFCNLFRTKQAAVHGFISVVRCICVLALHSDGSAVLFEMNDVPIPGWVCFPRDTVRMNHK